jgi:O-antigen ligase
MRALTAADRLAPARFALACALAALPWLDPFALGPSASVQPWLASMACGVALWILALTGGTDARLRLAAPCAAIVGWASVSHLSLHPDVVFLAGGLVLIAVGATAVADPQVARGMRIGLLLAAAVSAVLGLLQYFGLAGALGPWVSRAEAAEAYANLRQPNQYATLCWIGAAVLLWGTTRLRTALAVPLVVLLAVGSAASVSRTALLEGLALTLLAAWWKGPERKRRLVLCAVAGAAYFAAAWLLPLALQAVTGALPVRTLAARLGSGEGCSSRLVLWSNVLHLIARKPILGWGWGDLDFAHFETLYAGPRFCDILDNAHNLPLHLAVELGVPAALVICAGVLHWAWRQRPWGETLAPRQLAWALLALLAIHSLLEYPLWYGPFQLACGAAVGWLAVPRERSAGGTLRREDRARGALRASSVMGAAVLLVANGYAAWDYERVSQIYLPPNERRAAWRDDAQEQALRSWLFSGQARFAELTLTTVTRSNARAVDALAHEVLHYSPEPRVIERAIESAALLGRDEEAVLDLARYRAAFPNDYEKWRAAQRLPLRVPQGPQAR